MTTNLLSIAPNVAQNFGRTYLPVAAINSFGYLQYFTPLGTATAIASLIVTCELTTKCLLFTSKQFSSLNWINDTSVDLIDTVQGYEKIEPPIDKEYKLKKSLWELKYVITAVAITSFALSYFTHAAATALVNTALTSAVTFLPNPALALCASLSISPMSLVVGTIFLVGALINHYQQNQQA